MLHTASNIVYKAFGLSVLSEMHLPELTRMSILENQPDITISISDLSIEWSAAAKPNRLFVVKEQVVMFQIPDVAIFSIQNGQEIIVSPIGQVSEDQLRLYILGTCMGTLLMQRRILPLHGSAIAIGGKAYAIVGDSGAGKSTLASAFLQKGYQLISDDIIPVTITKEDIPFVTPAYPQQKLWQESLDAFGLNSEKLRPIVERETKFAVPVPKQFVTDKLPLSGVFELVKTETDSISISPITSLNCLHTLLYHTYRNFLLSPSGLMDWHFLLTAKIVNKVQMFKICRPSSQFTAHELANLIVSTINKEEE